MGMTTQWRTPDRSAEACDLAQALALGRQHQRKLSLLESEARQRDAYARRVGASIRKTMREQARSRFPINCRPARTSGSRKGRARIRSFETMLGLLHPTRSFVARDGFSSFHCKFTSRGLGGRRRAKDRPYTRGEAVRAVRYFLREAAREIAGGGIVSSISNDPDEIASVFAALEELEQVGGRKNANVYMSLVISLPHELEHGREALLARICEPFAEHDLPLCGRAA